MTLASFRFLLFGYARNQITAMSLASFRFLLFGYSYNQIPAMSLASFRFLLFGYPRNQIPAMSLASFRFLLFGYPGNQIPATPPASFLTTCQDFYTFYVLVVHIVFLYVQKFIFLFPIILNTNLQFEHAYIIHKRKILLVL